MRSFSNDPEHFGRQILAGRLAIEPDPGLAVPSRQMLINTRCRLETAVKQANS